MNSQLLNIAAVDTHSTLMLVFSVIIYVSGAGFLIGSGIYLYAARHGFTRESEELRGLGGLIAFFSGIPLAIGAIISMVAGLIWGVSSALDVDPNTALPVLALVILGGIVLVILADVVANIK